MPDVSLLQREYYGGGEEESRTPGIVALGGFVLLIVVVGVFVGLYVYNRSLITKAQVITENIKGLHVGDVAETINELKELEDMANGLKGLREGHTSAYGLLTSIEKTTHPETIFSRADIDAKKRSVAVEGVTKTTRTMARQVEIYQKEAEILDFFVEDVVYGDERMVGFHADIVFKEK